MQFMETEKRLGRGKGDILGISGNSFFGLFDDPVNTLTTADYPLVSCEDMPYDDNMFDNVLSEQVLEHVRKPWLCTDEFWRVLKPGGRVIIVVPAVVEEHRYPMDNWRVLIDGMYVLLEGFTNVSVGSYGDGELLKYFMENPTETTSTRALRIAHNEKGLRWTVSTNKGEKQTCC